MARWLSILVLMVVALVGSGCTPPPQAAAKQKLSEALVQRQDRQEKAHKLHQEGRALLDEHKPAAAQDKFRQAVKADDVYASAWVGLGVACYQQQDWAGALQAFEQARILVPKRPEPHYNLGMTLEAVGQYNRAIEYYERALKLSPDHLEASENLIRCLVVTRTKPTRALELTRKVLPMETRPQWRDWLSLQQTLLSKPDAKVAAAQPEAP